MKFSIREAEKEDMQAVFNLIKELAIFEKEPNAVEITVDDLVKDGFGSNQQFKVFLAEVEGEIGGMALFYPRYSTWQGKALHLEDLIVSQKYRGLGLGKGLYRKIIEYAYENGINRLEWEVLDWNKGAIDFYLASGALMHDNWNMCQMTRQQMEDYLAR